MSHNVFVVNGPTGVSAVYAGNTLMGTQLYPFKSGDYIPAMRATIPNSFGLFTSATLFTESKAKMRLNDYPVLVEA
jgi:hypothetical protein